MPEDIVYKKWCISVISIVMLAVIVIASITIYIDPLFHYHEPLDNYEYLINDERYQNDGITRNFQYDSIITGTSMAENFKTSEANEIFDAQFIKVPYSGGYYKEINDNIKRAYSSGKNIKYVIRSLDNNYLMCNEDSKNPIKTYPMYLYNNDIFDDVSYLLNKTMLLEKVLGGG